MNEPMKASTVFLLLFFVVGKFPNIAKKGAVTQIFFSKKFQHYTCMYI